MTLFFDFYEIALGKGKSIGIYNYALHLLNALAKQKDRNDEIVVACSEENSTALQLIGGIKIKIISEKYPNFKQRLLWRLFKAIDTAKKEKATIYFSPKGFAPSLFIRNRNPFIVVTVHDMIPFYYAENYPGYFGKFESKTVPQSLKKSIEVANKVITISNFSKETILRYAHPQSEVAVIYNGMTLPEKVEKEALEATPYLLAIASKLPHKNLEGIVNGYKEYRKIVANPLPLVICGIDGTALKAFDIEGQGISSHYFLPDRAFNNLLANASLLLFLPVVEGFGFPPLEAMNYGIASVVSDIPVLREIMGTAAYYTDCNNVVEIGKAIDRVLSDTSVYHFLIEEGKGALKKYTWDNCAKQVMDVFEEVSRT